MSVGAYATVPVPETFNMVSFVLDENITAGRGQRVAVRFHGDTLTYADLCALTNKAGNVLKELGVERENRVLVVLRDSPEWVASWLGAIKIGAIATHAYPFLPAEDYGYFLDYVRPEVVVVDESTLEKVREGAKRARYPVRLLVQCGPGTRLEVGEVDFDSMVRSAGAGLEAEPTSRDDVAVWNWSGGTTGRPKAVQHMHHDVAVAFESLQQLVRYAEDDVVLNVPKLFFHYAHDIGMNFVFRAGGALVLFPERTTPELVFDLVRRHRPTLLINVPSMMKAMLEAGKGRRGDLASLRLMFSSGETLSARLYEAWIQAFGVEVMELLGSAESYLAYIVSCPGAKVPGSIGKVAPLVEAKIVDSDGGEVAQGEQGVLMIRADSVGSGYYLNHEKSKRTFLGEDWLNTGDICRQDSEGNFCYCGRRDDLVKVSGIWVAPFEVEARLQEHRKVRECTVLGVLTEDDLVRLKAYVVLQEGVEATESLIDEFVAFCKEGLAAHKYPRMIEFLPVLPRTGQGKVDRGVLGERGRLCWRECEQWGAKICWCMPREATEPA